MVHSWTLDFNMRLKLCSIFLCCSGSPPVHGEGNEDVDVDDVSDYNYPAPGNQDQKQKIAERMLTWRTNSRGSDIGLAKYDSGEIGHGKYDSGEIPRGYIPSLTHSQVGVETLDYYKVIVLNIIQKTELMLSFFLWILFTDIRRDSWSFP